MQFKFHTTNDLNRQPFFFATVPIGRPRLGTVPNPENLTTQEVSDKLDFRGNKNFDRSNMQDVVQNSDDYVDDGNVPVTVDAIRQKPVESEDVKI